MKKIIRALLWIVLVVVLAVVVTVVFFGGPMIRSAVNTAGPKLLGVPVTLADAKFSPLQGQLVLDRLHVGNPEGFKTDSLFEVDRVEVELDVKSLLSDTIVVRRVLVNAPQITMERGLTSSNLSTLLKNLEGEPKDGEKSAEKPSAEEEKPAAPKKAGKKVVIDDLKVTGGQANLSVTLAQGTSASIALGEIHMTNVGREEGSTGLGIPDIVRIVVTTIIKSVIETVGNVGGAAVEGVTAAGEMALEGATAVGGAAVEGATAVGGAAVEGVSAAGSAAAEGVKKIGGGIGRAVGGLFGNESTPEPTEPEQPAEEQP
ncbi:MAG: AsmA family protein [Kiritimatiellae bacterium]|nr:AsmA family protein [Kiritimatiellia bacterium]